MIIGVIYVCWRSEDLIARSLTPWVEARARKLEGCEFRICAVSVPFKGFDQPAPTDRTVEILQGFRDSGAIDHLITSSEPLSETEARGAALSYLVNECECTHLWQADGDELPTLSQLSSIVKGPLTHPFVAWWRLSYRNAVFTEDQYLADPFQPARIHRVNLGMGHVATRFWDDNNVCYLKEGGQEVKDLDMPCMVVPPNVAWIRHFSWLNNETSRRKIQYQIVGRNWPECSFRWNTTTNSLSFNEDYYRRRGQPLPVVLRDDPATDH